MFDVGDLPVLTFGNWVLKAEWLSGLWNYVYVFYVFSKSKKIWLYVFFELLHTFSPTAPRTQEAVPQRLKFVETQNSFADSFDLVWIDDNQGEMWYNRGRTQDYFFRFAKK